MYDSIQDAGKGARYLIRWPKSEKMNKTAFPLFWLYNLYDLRQEATILRGGEITEPKKLSEELEYEQSCQKRSRRTAGF